MIVCVSRQILAQSNHVVQASAQIIYSYPVFSSSYFISSSCDRALHISIICTMFAVCINFMYTPFLPYQLIFVSDIRYRFYSALCWNSMTQRHLHNANRNNKKLEQHMFGCTYRYTRKDQFEKYSMGRQT